MTTAGGFGANPAVWLFMTLVRAGRLVLGQDGRSTAGLVKNARQRGERGQVRFLGALDAREGARPAIVGRCALLDPTTWTPTGTDAPSGSPAESSLTDTTLRRACLRPLR